MKKNLYTVTFALSMLAACHNGISGTTSLGDNNNSIPADTSGEWELVAGQINGKTLNLQDGKITLRQDEDAFTGVSAVNHYRVPVKIRGERIEHGNEPPTTTLMAGSVEAMRLENDYLEAMSAVKNIKREGEQLIISGDGIELQFRLTH